MHSTEFISFLLLFSIRTLFILIAFLIVDGFLSVCWVSGCSQTVPDSVLTSCQVYPTVLPDTLPDSLPDTSKKTLEEVGQEQKLLRINSDSLDDLKGKTIRQLKAIASQKGVAGYGRMNKAELIQKLSK